MQVSLNKFELDTLFSLVHHVKSLFEISLISLGTKHNLVRSGRGDHGFNKKN